MGNHQLLACSSRLCQTLLEPGDAQRLQHPSTSSHRGVGILQPALHLVSHRDWQRPQALGQQEELKCTPGRLTIR